MEALISLVKYLFVGTITVVSTLNPFVSKPTPIPLPINIETPIKPLSPTPYPTVISIQKSTYIDPDPVISCNYKYLGTQQIKKSLCDAQFECQLAGKWYFYTSREKCKQDQDAYWRNYYGKNGSVANSTYVSLPTSSAITCIVNYPCTGNSYTYRVDQSTCNFMQSGAASTCSTADAIKKMQDIGNAPYPTVIVPTIDTSIHIDPAPTSGVPYGFSNVPDAQ